MFELKSTNKKKNVASLHGGLWGPKEHHVNKYYGLIGLI